MGVFDLALVCPHGRIDRCLSLPNYLMYRGQDRLLRRILPPQSGELTWEIGFSGPMYRRSWDRPNYDNESFALGPRNSLAQLVGDDPNANDGGLPAQDMRDLFAYAHQAVVWNVVVDGTGAIVQTDWTRWINRVLWARHGDWTPEGWDADLQGPFVQPWQWANCPPIQLAGDLVPRSQGWPWCYPRIHPDWWLANEFSVACSNCQAENPYGLGGYPIGCVFLVVKKSGTADEVFAAAETRAALHWRMGGAIAARYRGRLG